MTRYPFGLPVDASLDISAGEMSVVNDGHTHTGATLSAIDPDTITGGVVIIVDNVSTSALGADIGSTSFESGGAAAGVYRASYYLWTTTTAVGSGGVTVTIGWNDGTAGHTVTSASIALTATEYAQGTVYYVRGAGAATYLTSHTGSYGTARYRLKITLELLSSTG